MSMIEQQVNKIRKVAKYVYLATDKEVANDIASTLNQAADTIEALSEKLAAANMERSDGYYGCGEDSYTVEQILDAITQADEEVISAIRYKDRDMLEDVLKDYLHK